MRREEPVGVALERDPHLVTTSDAGADVESAFRRSNDARFFTLPFLASSPYPIDDMPTSIAAAPAPKLLRLVSQAARVHRYSPRTEEAYVGGFAGTSGIMASGIRPSWGRERCAIS